MNPGADLFCSPRNFQLLREYFPEHASTPCPIFNIRPDAFFGLKVQVDYDLSDEIIAVWNGTEKIHLPVEGWLEVFHG